MGFETKSFARLIGLVMLVLLAGGALIGGTLRAQAGVPTSIPASDPASKIDKQVLKDTANGQKASFVILLADQADVSRGLYDERPGRTRVVCLQHAARHGCPERKAPSGSTHRSRRGLPAILGWPT